MAPNFLLDLTMAIAVPEVFDVMIFTVYAVIFFKGVARHDLHRQRRNLLEVCHVMSFTGHACSATNVKSHLEVLGKASSICWNHTTILASTRV